MRWRACLFALVCAAAFGARPAGAQAALPELKTARSVHILTTDQAAKAYPVHLARATVLFNMSGNLFVHDRTGGVYVDMGDQPDRSIRAGSIVDVVGVSEPGNFSPVIRQTQVRVVGQGGFPEARVVSLDHLLTGIEEAQWVEVEGIVRSVDKPEIHPSEAKYAADLRKRLDIDMATGAGHLAVITFDTAGKDYSHLVDARVRFRGVAAPSYNDRRQLTGIHLFTPSLELMQVLEPAPSDPFSLPVQSVMSVMQYLPGVEIGHRIRVQGVVILSNVGLLSISDENHGLFVRTDDKNRPKIGDFVDVVGFPEMGDYSPVLADVAYRKLGVSPMPPIRSATLKELTAFFPKDADAEVVRIEGRLLEQSANGARRTLLMESDGATFTAVMAGGEGIESLAALKEGSILSLTGVCSVETFDDKSPETIQILLRSGSDVAVLLRPSWWTPRHTIEVSGVIAAIAFVSLAWIVVLRRRVEQQTQVIRESEEQLRRLSQHDALTGLPNRYLLADRMSVALARAERLERGLALVMVDLDGFKQINDSLGHLAGDQLLCEVAKRLISLVRKADTVARIGGDEFIVLLSDMQVLKEAEAVAAKIVEAISAPIYLDGCAASVSASVGVSAFPEGGMEMTSLLHSVDVAMYRAKSLGRNRFQVYSREMTEVQEPESLALSR